MDRPNRTGVLTAVTGLAKDNGMAAKGLGRHSHLATPTAHYVQTVPSETLAAMTALVQAYADCGGIVGKQVAN
jgi:hypothetical protein